jgi:hypothetical protein
MSYSFQVSGATKAEAIAKVAEKLAEVVLAQPPHAADQAQAQNAVESFVDLLADDETQDVSVTVHGSLWNSDAGILSANVNVTATIAPRAA